MFNSNQSNLFDCVMKPESTVSSQNSDEDIETSIMMKRDRRRELHTQAEQRRRDAIKNGYETLLPLIQTNNAAESLAATTSHGSTNLHSNSNNSAAAGSISKLSKATILQRTVSHIRNLTEQTTQKEKELENLKNELFALGIMNSNYEEMAKGTNKKTSSLSASQSNGVNNNLQNSNQSEEEDDEQVSERVKFDIFTQFLLALFQSFDTHTKFDNFTSASTSIIHWMEEYCKPQNLNQITESILTEVLSNCYCASSGSNITNHSSPNSSNPIKNQNVPSLGNKNIAELLSKNNFHINQTSNNNPVLRRQNLSTNDKFPFHSYHVSPHQQNLFPISAELQPHQSNSRIGCYDNRSQGQALGYLGNRFRENTKYHGNNDNDNKLDSGIKSMSSSSNNKITSISNHGNVDEMMAPISPNIDLTFLENIDHDTLMSDILF